MNKLGASLLAALVPLAAGTAVWAAAPAGADTAATALGATAPGATAPPPASSGAPAPTTTSAVTAGPAGAPGGPAPTWSALQRSAVQAASAFGGTGQVDPSGPLGPVSVSTVTTEAGRITVAQRTEVATGPQGTVVLQLALLGGSQLVVSETSPGTGGPGETLVLQPGSSTVAGAYPIPATPTAATAAAVRHRRGAIATDSVVRTLPGTHRAGVRLTAVNGCYASPPPPGVIGSVFGPLIQGEGVVYCYNSSNMAAMAAIYQGSTQASTPSGASGTGYYLGVNTYAPCYLTSGARWFHTAELWAVNGVLQGGATSYGAYLHCA